MENCVNRIRELERLFSDNQYDGRGEKAFCIEEGNIPIMVSAPHAINHFRDGHVKRADVYTGGITRFLHEATGCHIIYSSKYTESDPNYDLPGTNRYQDELVSYFEKHRVFVLLDLHGASKNREYAIELGTAPKQYPEPGMEYEKDPSLHEYKFISTLIGQLFEKKFADCSTDRKSIWKNRIFGAGGQNTITKYISENTSTACIQLEINGIYRNPENRKEFLSLINGLIELIRILADIDWTQTDIEIPRF